MIDSLMTLGAKETVGRVKMAVEVEQIGAGAPWENALLFWVNRVRPHSPQSQDVQHFTKLLVNPEGHKKSLNVPTEILFLTPLCKASCSCCGHSE